MGRVVNTVNLNYRNETSTSLPAFAADRVNTHREVLEVFLIC